MQLVITGAAGALGRRVAEHVLERGIPAGSIILVTRRPEEIIDLARQGADVRRGDFDDPKLLREAFAGGDRMLLISTDAVGRREVQHRAAIAAAREAGVRHVAYTSMLNPTDGNPAGVAREHRVTEQELLDSGLAWTFLRNGLYAEYEVPPGATALLTGQLVTNAPDGRTAYVAREDCAAAAAAVLTGDGHEHHVYDVTGPELLSKRDEAAMLTEIGGRPVEVIGVDDDTFIAELGGLGLPQAAAVMIASFGAAIREGYLDQLGDGVQQLTGRPPRALREVFEAHAMDLAPPS
jgi:NAD(P)H dehydrogenase (quinone)